MVVSFWEKLGWKRRVVVQIELINETSGHRRLIHICVLGAVR